MTKRCAQRHRSVLVVFIFHARTDRIWPPVLGQLDSRIYRPSKRSSPGTVSFRAFTHALKNQCLPPRVTIVINGEKKLANDLRKISLPPFFHFDPFEEEREEIGRRGIGFWRTVDRRPVQILRPVQNQCCTICIWLAYPLVCPP